MVSVGPVCHTCAYSVTHSTFLCVEDRPKGSQKSSSNFRAKWYRIVSEVVMLYYIRECPMPGRHKLTASVDAQMLKLEVGSIQEELQLTYSLLLLVN